MGFSVSIWKSHYSETGVLEKSRSGPVQQAAPVDMPDAEVIVRVLPASCLVKTEGATQHGYRHFLFLVLTTMQN